ncbi:BLUF domain-containing protein [Hymenobacter psychrotolerans]|uniref:Sensors of blue-light using FAD n=1 Tax=Hymenobacter psychrotolerans DSM 18569 TaxID=1121959 RepID=A0A1M6P5X2_9BACT|nr:BLUF domain-containing protein [Hymenobacter psychrotolerans]SHK03256.1 Sensors of blue-light using FAD [Hymenobacter psychrotolerans DSM 18569]
MHHLIYSSTATRPLSEEELRGILHKARHHNEQHNLTGILLYHEGQIVQLLEGPEEAVHTLYGYIAQDPRHTGLIKLADKHVPQRSFPDWSMAFQTLSDEQYALLEGYRTPENLDLSPPGLSAADTMLLELMRTFMLRDESEAGFMQ